MLAEYPSPPKPRPTYRRRCVSPRPHTQITLLPVELKEVSFGGGNHTLTSDDGNTDYLAPHWVDEDGDGDPSDTTNGERNYSVAYTIETKPSIGATFSIEDLPSNLEIKLRATGSDGIKIPETDAEIEGNNVTLPMTPSSTNWPDVIRFYDRSDDNKAFELDWEIKIGDGDWGKIGSTKHQVYLTLKSPDVPVNRETLFYLACHLSNGLDGSNINQVVNKIYEEFSDKEVYPLDADTGDPRTINPLRYYGAEPYDHPLVAGAGVCSDWANFLVEVVKVHNIKAEISDVSVPNGLAFHLNQFVDPPNRRGTSDLDLARVPGTPGDQGGVNHQVKGWSGHCISKINDKYFDPSYGIGPFNGEIDYEEAAVGAIEYTRQQLWGFVTPSLRQQRTGIADLKFTP